MENSHKIIIRNAKFDDVAKLEKLIEASVHDLQKNEYTQSQRDAALGTIFGIDTNLLKDKTYFIVEINNEIAACGGWSYRKAMFGADSLTSQEPQKLDPNFDAARIRAFFISPKFARMGLGKLILEHCENEARAAGFKMAELGSTLTGIPFYRKYGYEDIKHIDAPLPNGESLGILLMGKTLN